MNHEDLVRYSTPLMLEKAQNIIDSDKIENVIAVKAGFLPGEGYELEANVKGSKGRSYNTYVEMSYDRGCIYRVRCECEYFRTNRKICKHCIATVMFYIESREGGSHGRDLKSSTKSLLNILKSYEKNSALETVVPASHEELVTLEPIFSATDNVKRIDVGFKIGRKKKYVIKNIIQFIEDVSNSKNVRYGKDLEFVHTKNAFDNKSKEWIELLEKYIEALTYSDEYYGYIEPRRELSLYDIEIDNAIKLCMDDDKLMYKDLGSSKAVSTALISGFPTIKIWIEKEDKGAKINYECPSCYFGREYIYILKDNMLFYEKTQTLKKMEAFLIYLTTSAPPTLFLGTQDFSLFTEELLPQLEEHLQVEFKDFNPDEYVKEKPQYEFRIDGNGKLDLVTCELRINYKNKVFKRLIEPNDKSSRNLKEELGLSYLVNKWFPLEHVKGYAMDGEEEELYYLLTYGIDELAQVGEVHVSESLLKGKKDQSPTIKMGVSIKGSLLELDIKSDDLNFDEIKEIISRYNPKKKYYRMQSGEFINMENSSLTALIQMNQDGKMNLEKSKSGKIKVPAYRALYLDQMLKDSREYLETTRNKKFKQVIRNMKTIEDSEYEVPTSIMAVLRPYQVLGFRWLKTMKNNGFGCILADDMGLGKTLQMITFLQSEREDNPNETRDVLVVCPASLLYNWESEIKKFAPNLSVEVIAGEQEERCDIISREGLGRVLITSYDLLRRDIETYVEKEFVTQIIDEAQYIKNHNTQMAKAVKLIQSEFTVAMTGTPVENRLSELWSIFDYLMPGFLYNYNQFRKEIELPIVQNNSQEAMTRLQKMVHPFILRRTKGEVLKDLPDKVEKISGTKIDGEQKELYDAHALRLKKMLEKQSDEEFKQGKIEVLAELTKLRQLCCHPSLLYADYNEESAKLELCMEYVRQGVQGRHKILLFSQFTSMLDIITQQLASEGISFYMLNGSTSKEKRRDLVEAFNKDDTSVFCISLKAGGTGLNLTSADMVIHFDPWWNAAAENQATDRAHRIGQKNTVNVYKLVVEETIEEKIVNLQSKKMELANQILSGESISTGAFTKEELLAIL